MTDIDCNEIVGDKEATKATKTTKTTTTTTTTRKTKTTKMINRKAPGRSHDRAAGIAALIAGLLLTVSACGGNGDSSGKAPSVTPAEGISTARTTQTQATSAPENSTLSDPAENGTAATGAFSVTGNGGAVDARDGVYTITGSGTYTLTGNLDGGRIVIDPGEEDGQVTVILNNAAITCRDGAPLSATGGDKFTVEAAAGTYNVITDGRNPAENETADGELNESGAIFSACDLKITGSGTLIVTAGFDNGIKSKDDLSVKDVTLKVTAPGNALKGNDSVTVESGKLVLISTGGDGIKTSATDVSSKGKQRGTVTVSGGQVDVYAAQDGIDAAYDAVIGGNATVNIFTSKYSGYESQAQAGNKLYLIVPASVYSTSAEYYAYFYNGGSASDDGNGRWVRGEYETMVYNGRRASYYALALNAPSDFGSVVFCIFGSGSAPSLSAATSKTAGESINTAMNAYLIGASGGGSISGDWARLSSGGGNSAKTAYSSKGIKAANEVRISSGSVSVSAGDDGIHANGGDVLENGAKGAGNVTISGGSVTIVSADDGIHADNEVTISDGSISVTGGTVVALGGICETPGSGSVNTFVSSGTSFRAGEYALKDSGGNLVLSFSLAGSYSSIWIASDGLSLNGSYSLVRGESETVLEWVQTASTVGSAGNNGGPGGGRPGGRW